MIVIVNYSMKWRMACCKEKWRVVDVTKPVDVGTVPV